MFFLQFFGIAVEQVFQPFLYCGVVVGSLFKAQSLQFSAAENADFKSF